MNLHVNIPHHRFNVKVEKHDPKANPFALSACENAYIEECEAKERDSRKKARAEDFNTNTRLALLKKIQDIEMEKERSNVETAEKIKKLLSDTIEFS